MFEEYLVPLNPLTTIYKVMNRIKQTLKPIYFSVKSTCMYRFVNMVLNILFRHNNFLVSLLLARCKGNKITIGRNVVFRYCKFEIHGSGNEISIGNDCNLSGLRIYINSHRNRIEIGQNTIVNASKEQRTLFNPCEGGEIVIGENCLFSNNIELHTTDYHKIMTNGTRSNPPQNIYIGNHCWIGLQSLILKGTKLADNSIVGAKRLLNKEFVEPNTIIAGNPGRVLKSNVNWSY